MALSASKSEPPNRSGIVSNLETDVARCAYGVSDVTRAATDSFWVPWILRQIWTDYFFVEILVGISTI